MKVFCVRWLNDQSSIFCIGIAWCSAFVVLCWDLSCLYNFRSFVQNMFHLSDPKNCGWFWQSVAGFWWSVVCLCVCLLWCLNILWINPDIFMQCYWMPDFIYILSIWSMLMNWSLHVAYPFLAVLVLNLMVMASCDATFVDRWSYICICLHMVNVY